MSTAREKMQYDIVIVGGGPSGLATAIHLKRLCQQNNLELSVCILEKGATIGAHILSGAVFEPDCLDKLIPDWQSKNAPVKTKVTKDEFYYFTKNKKIKLPTPKTFHNHGNYIISLSNLCQWLATEAQELGVEIYPGFAASDVIITNNQVLGVITNDIGIAKDGSKSDQYQAGIEIHAKQTILAEGCRGSISKQVIKHFGLDNNCCPQTYGLGIKEIWQIDKKYHQEGLVMHSIGWPLDNNTYGGSFIYYLENNKIAYGFVVGLDYTNPYLSPFQEAQRFKLHPAIRPMFESGERIYYGAKSLTEGGFQSLPKLTFPGGLIVGDAAGFLNVAKIKGSHNAIKSGMIAAEAIIEKITTQNSSSADTFNQELTNYSVNIKKSDIIRELYKVRNIRPSFKYGLFGGLAYSALDNYILQGKAPWTFKHQSDHESLLPIANPKVNIINYPKPDNKITFDRLSSVFLSNTHHNENQPSHLKLIDNNIPVNTNLKIYGGPEQYYCPAGVYEYLSKINAEGQEEKYLQINAQNCVHCKTCDIKDPKQNINWQPPEGGGGPCYTDM